MQDMEPNEGTIYPDMRIAQNGVGMLEVEAMAFSSISPEPHTRFAHRISICDASKNPIGWGDVIFKGTLKELIDLITKKEKTNERQNT